MDKLFIGRFDNSMIQDISEFSKRYTGTWIYDEIAKSPFYVDQANPDYAILTNIDCQQEKVTICTNRIFSARKPIIGFFNTKTSFNYGIRVPNRQYKRGICEQNYNAIDSIKSLTNKRIVTNHLPDVIKYAYTETKSCILDTIRDLETQSLLGRVLNKDFAVSLNTFSEENIYLLWYKNKPVAEIYPNTESIRIRYKHIKQEIMDYNKYIESKKWKII